MKIKTNKINDKIFDVVSFYQGSYNIKGVQRSTLYITITNSNYAEIKENFVDGLEIEEVKLTNETTSSDAAFTPYKEFNVVGEIRDNLNGTFTVLIGKKTLLEEAQEKVLALETENAELLFQNLTGEEFAE